MKGSTLRETMRASNVGKAPFLRIALSEKKSHGAAISDENGKSHEASTAARQRSSEAEPHDGCHAPFGFYLRMLHAWGLLISVYFGISDGWKFCMNHLCLSQEYCFLTSPGKS